MLYGRWPAPAETQRLMESVSVRQPRQLPSHVRTVLNLFNQASYGSPFSVQLTAEDVRVVEYAGIKIATDATDWVISHEIRHANYERHMVNFFQHVLRPGMTMIDVGANIGLFSLLAAKIVGATGKVYSIEPRGENARLLLYSAALNHFDNIHLLPTAVGDATGYTLYQTHIGANGALMSKNGDDAGFTDHAILNPTSQVVPMARLDNLISEPVDIIKLDIEGAEGMALRGGSELVRANRPIITSEASAEMLGRVSNTSLRDYLVFTRTQGYRQFVIDRCDSHLREVGDLDDFLAAWPGILHIEDFAFVPQEKMGTLATLDVHQN